VQNKKNFSDAVHRCEKNSYHISQKSNHVAHTKKNLSSFALQIDRRKQDTLPFVD
jgi:hypothetical protein